MTSDMLPFYIGNAYFVFDTRNTARNIVIVAKVRIILDFQRLPEREP